eukprot:scaffold6403_cov128-Skeletonema_dohrnii-CCMP3373.AAC.12
MIIQRCPISLIPTTIHCHNGSLADYSLPQRCLALQTFGCSVELGVKSKSSSSSSSQLLNPKREKRREGRYVDIKYFLSTVIALQTQLTSQFPHPAGARARWLEKIKLWSASSSVW